MRAVIGKDRDLGGSPPRVQVVGMRFVGRGRIRSEDKIGLKVRDGPGDPLQQLFPPVEAAVGKPQKADVIHAEQGGPRTGFFFPAGRQGFGRQTFIQVLGTVASVGADQKADLFAGRRQFGGRRSGADLDIVRMRTDKQITLKSLRLRQRRRKAKDQTGK